MLLISNMVCIYIVYNGTVIRVRIGISEGMEM